MDRSRNLDEGPGDLISGTTPERVGRHPWELEDTARDVGLLWWIERFRFVTPEAIAARFEITVQRARARLRRLERAGLLGSWRGHVSQAKAVWITGKGCDVLGRRRRRPPRPTQAREHEDAIVDLAVQLELGLRHIPGQEVLTERQCRSREHRMGRNDNQSRYSARVFGTGRAFLVRRWPDLVIERGRRRDAFEIELSPKHTERLGQIVIGYASSSYERVMWVVRSPRLAARLAGLFRAQGTRFGGDRVTFIIDPLPSLDAATRAAIERAAGPYVYRPPSPPSTGP